VPELRAVEVESLPLGRFAPLLGEDRFNSLMEMAAGARQTLAGSTVWTVNSTAAGGGVAEMLRVIVGYSLDAGVDVRWRVISGDAAFFATTKRIHNQLHGFPGGGELQPEEMDHYRSVTDELGAELAALVQPGDVVLLHDPQTAGMTARLAASGAHVVWRCHIGVDQGNSWTEAAWAFLRPLLEQCQAFVFSRRSYAPEWIPDEAVMVIPPSIDPFSPKNEDLSQPEVGSILQAAGVFGGTSTGPLSLTREDGRPLAITHRASMVGECGPIDPSVPLVVQVSRWDRLKDMAGVMTGFVYGVPATLEAQLALVGPAVAAVSDDPEGAEVLAECRMAWEALSTEMRRRVTLVTLPMDDLDENAVMVNALQRHATVVVQKSLAEGFGLTVAEAMWKSKAVVASNVGGIADQITPGTGILLHDPADLHAFGEVLSGLLADPSEIARLGTAARKRVLDGFVGDQHLAAYARLLGELHLG
jgi:trehalose synthase